MEAQTASATQLSVVFLLVSTKKYTLSGVTFSFNSKSIKAMTAKLRG